MLQSIGADRRVYAEFARYAEEGLELARVAVMHRGEYRIFLEDGEASAEVIGALLYQADGAWALPAVGDWVAARRHSRHEAMIHAVLPRLTKFSRRAAGDREEEQVIAANIDVVLVVCGLDGDFNPRRIERYLLLAEESGAEAAVVLNKSDVCLDVAARVAEAREVARGAPVVAISAQAEGGAEPVTGLIGYGRTGALVGSSGAGKSTIVNRLVGEERQEVQAVREDDSRGRHTTTRRELIPLDGGGALIDTPGMRELQLWADSESVDGAFDDISALAAWCRFRDCGHDGEPGCAVRAALSEGRLTEERWESYRKLRAEAAWHVRQVDMGAAAAERRKWKQIHKAMRKHGQW